MQLRRRRYSAEKAEQLPSAKHGLIQGLDDLFLDSFVFGKEASAVPEMQTTPALAEDMLRGWDESVFDEQPAPTSCVLPVPLHPLDTEPFLEDLFDDREPVSVRATRGRPAKQPRTRSSKGKSADSQKRIKAAKAVKTAKVAKVVIKVAMPTKISKAITINPPKKCVKRSAARRNHCLFIIPPYRIVAKNSPIKKMDLPEDIACSIPLPLKGFVPINNGHFRVQIQNFCGSGDSMKKFSKNVSGLHETLFLYEMALLVADDEYLTLPSLLQSGNYASLVALASHSSSPFVFFRDELEFFIQLGEWVAYYYREKKKFIHPVYEVCMLGGLVQAFDAIKFGVFKDECVSASSVHSDPKDNARNNPYLFALVDKHFPLLSRMRDLSPKEANAIDDNLLLDSDPSSMSDAEKRRRIRFALRNRKSLSQMGLSCLDLFQKSPAEREVPPMDLALVSKN